MRRLELPLHMLTYSFEELWKVLQKHESGEVQLPAWLLEPIEDQLAWLAFVKERGEDEIRLANEMELMEKGLDRK